VACGVGYGSYLLATEGQAAHVTGLDISGPAIAHAKTHYQLPHLLYDCMDAHSLAELAHNPFDVVISMGTLEHIKDPVTFADSVRSVLKREGAWVVTMLNPAIPKDPDPFHFQEFDVPQFKRFLSLFFRDVHILGHQLRHTGQVKRNKSVARFATVPRPIKQLARPLLGSRLSWKLRSCVATCLEPTDYVWTDLTLSNSIEFLGVCRDPK
jgi:2-polyprenyl-3-methyl-5-hydroxy-6-metoxy-1,4-benzoquinol methylase